MPASRLHDALTQWFWRLAASGLLSPRRFGPPVPAQRAARRGELAIEIVSHCWNYSHLLAYQLSSLVNHPPARAQVTMSVYHAAEDIRTVALLETFGGIAAPNVNWNWQTLAPEQLFRRAIGRNHAALNTRADWIWFTDCDVVFHAGCLDGLTDVLQGRDDVLVFPRSERITDLLADDDPMLAADTQPGLVDISTQAFTERNNDRATGPLQITHGDVARACGYCRDIAFYQQPVAAFAKCHEDRAFRWLLGSQGVPVEIGGLHRIRHESKGRYRGGWRARLRGAIRRAQEPRRRSKEPSS